MAMDEKLREQINKERASGLAAVARLEKQVSELRELLGDIKAWDVANYMTLPYDLRVRIQSKLAVPNVEVSGRPHLDTIKEN